MYNLNDIKQYEEKKKAQQPSPMPGTAPASTPAAPVQEVPKDTGLQQQRREELKSDMTKPLNASPSMGDVAFNNTAKPVLEKWDLDKMAESQRNNYMQSFDTWAEAEKRGDISQKDWANAKVQQMIAEGKNPGEYLNTLALIGAAETPEQKRKRERREALGETFRGLGNLIGNVANLYYTHRGGQYIDLNSVNEKHRERMEKVKEKQDALAEQRQQILLKAKMGDIKNERAERAAAKKAETEAEERAWKVKYDAYMKELDNAYRMGQIDAQTKANMLRDLSRAKTNADLEAVKHKYAMELEGARQAGRKELEGIKEDNKKSTLTYQGTAYKKKDLASMIRLYNKVKADGYEVSEVERATIGNYIKAILEAKKPGLEKDMKAGDAFGNSVLPDLVIEDSDADTQQERDYSQYKEDEDDFSANKRAK